MAGEEQLLHDRRRHRREQQHHHLAVARRKGEAVAQRTDPGGEPPARDLPRALSAAVSSRNSCSVEGGRAWHTMCTVSPLRFR